METTKENTKKLNQLELLIAKLQTQIDNLSNNLEKWNSLQQQSDTATNESLDAIWKQVASYNITSQQVKDLLVKVEKLTSTQDTYKAIVDHLKNDHDLVQKNFWKLLVGIGTALILALLGLALHGINILKLFGGY